MKAGFGTRSTDVESITDDSTTGKLNTDESDLVISVEVNSTGQVLMIKILKIKKIQMQLLWGSNSRTNSVNYQVQLSGNIVQDLSNPDDISGNVSNCGGNFLNSSIDDRTNAGGAISFSMMYA